MPPTLKMLSSGLPTGSLKPSEWLEPPGIKRQPSPAEWGSPEKNDPAPAESNATRPLSWPSLEAQQGSIVLQIPPPPNMLNQFPGFWAKVEKDNNLGGPAQYWHGDPQPDRIWPLSQSAIDLEENGTRLSKELDEAHPRIAINAPMMQAYNAMRGHSALVGPMGDPLRNALYVTKDRVVGQKPVRLPFTGEREFDIDAFPGAKVLYFDPLDGKPKLPFSEPNGRSTSAKLTATQAGSKPFDWNAEKKARYGEGITMGRIMDLSDPMYDDGAPLRKMTKEEKIAYDKIFEGGITDDEDNPGDSVMDPKLFALMAQGCADNSKDEFITKPMSPNQPIWSKKPPPVVAASPRKVKYTRQWDKFNGGSFSDEYSVEKEPALLIEPAGVDMLYYPSALDRHLPAAGKALKEQAYGKVPGEAEVYAGFPIHDEVPTGAGASRPKGSPVAGNVISYNDQDAMKVLGDGDPVAGRVKYEELQKQLKDINAKKEEQRDVIMGHHYNRGVNSRQEEGLQQEIWAIKTRREDAAERQLQLTRLAPPPARDLPLRDYPVNQPPPVNAPRHSQLVPQARFNNAPPPALNLQLRNYPVNQPRPDNAHQHNQLVRQAQFDNAPPQVDMAYQPRPLSELDYNQMRGYGSSSLNMSAQDQGMGGHATMGQPHHNPNHGLRPYYTTGPDGQDRVRMVNDAEWNYLLDQVRNGVQEPQLPTPAMPLQITHGYYHPIAMYPGFPVPQGPQYLAPGIPSYPTYAAQFAAQQQQAQGPHLHVTGFVPYPHFAGQPAQGAHYQVAGIPPHPTYLAQHAQGALYQVPGIAPYPVHAPQLVAPQVQGSYYPVTGIPPGAVYAGQLAPQQQPPQVPQYQAPGIQPHPTYAAQQTHGAQYQAGGNPSYPTYAAQLAAQQVKGHQYQAVRDPSQASYTPPSAAQQYQRAQNQAAAQQQGGQQVEANMYGANSAMYGYQRHDVPLLQDAPNTREVTGFGGYPPGYGPNNTPSFSPFSPAPESSEGPSNTDQGQVEAYDGELRLRDLAASISALNESLRVQSEQVGKQGSSQLSQAKEPSELDFEDLHLATPLASDVGTTKQSPPQDQLQPSVAAAALPRASKPGKSPWFNDDLKTGAASPARPSGDFDPLSFSSRMAAFEALNGPSSPSAVVRFPPVREAFYIPSPPPSPTTARYEQSYVTGALRRKRAQYFTKVVEEGEGEGVVGMSEGEKEKKKKYLEYFEEQIEESRKEVEKLRGFEREAVKEHEASRAKIEGLEGELAALRCGE